jgi:hypothetical protein
MKNEKEKIELLLKVFDNQQTLISNTDTKSNITIGLQTFVLTTILGASIISNTLNNVLQHSWIIKIAYLLVLITFLFTSILGLTYCILVFRPRPPQEKKETKRSGISYFGHISRYKDSESYLDTIREIDLSDIIKEFAFQNYTLAIILDQKMKYIKRSANLLFINILIGLTLLIFSLLIN